jgi:hypothetical protein
MNKAEIEELNGEIILKDIEVEESKSDSISVKPKKIRISEFFI